MLAGGRTASGRNGLSDYLLIPWYSSDPADFLLPVACRTAAKRVLRAASRKRLFGSGRKTSDRRGEMHPEESKDRANILRVSGKYVGEGQHRLVHPGLTALARRCSRSLT